MFEIRSCAYKKKKMDVENKPRCFVLKSAKLGRLRVVKKKLSFMLLLFEKK